MFLFEKSSCAAEIFIRSDAVDFLTKSLGMPYSVITAQQGCSSEMVKAASSYFRTLTFGRNWMEF